MTRTTTAKRTGRTGTARRRGRPKRRRGRGQVGLLVAALLRSWVQAVRTEHHNNREGKQATPTSRSTLGPNTTTGQHQTGRDSVGSQLFEAFRRSRPDLFGDLDGEPERDVAAAEPGHASASSTG